MPDRYIITGPPEGGNRYDVWRVLDTAMFGTAAGIIGPVVTPESEVLKLRQEVFQAQNIAERVCKQLNTRAELEVATK